MDWPARFCDVEITGLRLRSETDSLPKVKPCQGAFQLNTMTCTRERKGNNSRNYWSRLRNNARTQSIPHETSINNYNETLS